MSERKEGKPGNEKSKQDNKNKKNNDIFSACFPGLVDLVIHKEKICYLYKNQGELQVLDRIKMSEKYYKPPDSYALPFKPLPAKKILAYQKDDEEKLYYSIIDKLKTISALPSEMHYHLVADYIFFTYLSEEAHYFPYLWFFGLPERGKSRTVKCVFNLSYRGLYTETLNQAYIFRFAELFHGTLVLDMYELSKRARMKDSYDLLLGRFEKGMKIPRVTAFDKGPFEDMKYYEVYGPTILATNTEIPENDPLRSRCIRIIMPEARGIYPDNSDEDFIDIKARLLAFRARHQDNPLPNIDKPIPGRLGDLMHPLLQIAKLLPEDALKNLESLVEEVEVERKESQAETLAGKIAHALYHLRGEVDKGRLPVTVLIDSLNKGSIYRSSDQAVGRELSAMGIQRKKSMGTMHIIWNLEGMEQIWKRYSIPSKESP